MRINAFGRVVEVFIVADGSAAHAIYQMFRYNMVGLVQRLQAQGVGVAGQKGFFFPYNFYGFGVKGFFNGKIGQVAFAGSRQRAVQDGPKRAGFGILFIKRIRRFAGAHGVAAGGPHANFIQFF